MFIFGLRFTVNSAKQQSTKSKPTERPHSLKTSSYSPGQKHGRKAGGTVEAESSNSDEEGPVAQQILSFVMDDPDFESKGLGVTTKQKVTEPVKELSLHALYVQMFADTCLSADSSETRSIICASFAAVTASIIL